MAERFVTFDITEVEEFIMAKETENRQFEEILPQELDNYLSRFLHSVRKKNGDEYEPTTLA